MAVCVAHTCGSSSLHPYHHREDSLLRRFSTTISSLPSISQPYLHRRQFVLLRRSTRSRFVLCLASGPGPPSPPDSDENPIRLIDSAGALSRFGDQIRIFFAVLFWMSLFFWASASDRDGKGKRKKGSRFK